MKDAAKRSPSAVESDTNPNSVSNPIAAFLAAHPGAVRTIAIGVAIGAAIGVGIGLFLPGRGAWYRAAVALLVALGCALIGGLVAGANAIPPRHWTVAPNSDWIAKVDTKMKAGTSNPVPRRVSRGPDKDK